jgi:hypothetical protein
MAREKSWLQLIRELIEALLKGFGDQNRVRTWHQHVVPYDGDWAVRREGNKPTKLSGWQRYEGF